MNFIYKWNIFTLAIMHLSSCWAFPSRGKSEYLYGDRWVVSCGNYLFFLNLVAKIQAASNIATIKALISVRKNTAWLELWLKPIPTNAHIITNEKAMSLRVAITRVVIIRTTITINVAHVWAFNPKPSQFKDTSVVATLATEAMVIHPR